ncbi:MAG: hypothetical protein ACRC2K_13180 [Clostridium sp.]
MDYRRTIKPSELDGKKFSYDDYKIIYKEDEIVRIDLIAIDGFSHKAVTFNNNLILYYRETDTYMYYFISDKGIGSRYKSVYVKESENDVNYFMVLPTVTKLVTNLTNYFEFSNEVCEGYGFLNENGCCFIPSKDNEIYYSCTYEDIKQDIKFMIKIDKNTYFEKSVNYSTLDNDVETSDIRRFGIFKDKEPFQVTEISRKDNTHYFIFGEEIYRLDKVNKELNKSIINATFVTPISASLLPNDRKILFQVRKKNKRTTGVSDIIKNTYDFFAW